METLHLGGAERRGRDFFEASPESFSAETMYILRNIIINFII